MAAAKDPAKTIETISVDAQKAVTDQVEKATKSMESVTAFSQETMDALMKSQGIAAKAAEELQAEAIAFSKKSVEEGVAHAKELAASQTLAELIEKQTGYAKASMEAMVKQSTRMNEMLVAAAKDVTAPIAARMTAATELMKAPMA
jgi:phasin family protein